MLIPTANQVAIAIVAACRETGEDPIRCASGAPAIRARHYALHALKLFFVPESREDRECLARVCGCPGKPLQFYNNSNTTVFRLFQWPKKLPDKKRRHWAAWFDDETFERVKDAVRASLKPTLPTVVKPKRQTIAEEFSGPLTMRRQPAKHFDDVTANLMGDPPRDRSALAQRLEGEC